MTQENLPQLELKATPQRLRFLVKEGVLSKPAFQETMKIIGYTPNATSWLKFLNVVLLILGVGFTVSGIFFFFAFNWADMHRFVKLGLLMITIVATIGGGFWLKLDNLPGKIALTAASLLVGALLAVYGQVYQTGADSYLLFLTWVGLIAGWIAIGQFTPLWFIGQILLNLSLGFYWVQRVGVVDSQFFFVFFALNGGAIIIWEVVHQLDISWLKSRWTPRLLGIPTFISLLIPTIMQIFADDLWLNEDPLRSFMVGLFILGSGVVLYTYSQKLLDLFMLTICLFSLIVAFNTLLLKILDFETIAMFCVSGAFIGQAALVVFWLRYITKQWQGVQSE